MIARIVEFILGSVAIVTAWAVLAVYFGGV